ncbi:ArsC/Spx/MgsR family protein [Lactococcus petauri]|uniref:ArsC/Spx/MgsR family protein n=1 Tax=Lactococcus petauri TaxID=1940789 RepID=UPI003853B53D
MPKIYYRKNCSSSRQAVQWFREHNIHFELISINQLPQKELLRLLSLTDKGFATILKRAGKGGKSIEKQISKLMMMNFNDAVNYLSATPELIKTPLIVEEDKFFSGYNREEIRQFIPREYRIQTIL